MNKSHLRWVPAIAVPAVVVAGAIAVPQIANADVKLPSKSPSAIVSLVQSSHGVSFSGTVSETADLGLPDLSSSSFGGGSDGSSISDALSQLTGTHKAKVYVSGTTASRVQTLDDLQERDVVRNGDNVWTYDSKTNAVTHVTLPSRPVQATPQTDTGQGVGSGAATPGTGWSGSSLTPQAVATTVLNDVKKYTRVTTSDNVKVAGRTAYGITLTPKSSTTLVKNVVLDVDSATGVPLRATITAKGQSKPAIQVGFTQISFSNPPASTFRFTPPKGATVKDVTVPTPPAAHAGIHPGAQTPGAQTQAGEAATAQKRAAAQAKYRAAVAKYQPQVIGSGWSTVLGVTLPSGALSGGSGAGGQASQLLGQVFTNVDGGRVLQTALVSVYLTDSGRLYVGAVSAKTLEAAAASQK